MKDEWLNVREYLELTKKRKIAFFKYFFFLLFLFVFSFIQIHTYQTVEGYVLDGMLVVNVHTNKLNTIFDKNTLYIGKKKYEYKVYDYKEEVISVGQQYFKEVRLKLNLEEQQNEDYKMVTVKIEQEKKRILEIFLSKLKGET